MRRGPALAVLLCLLGAFLVLVAAGRTWLSGVEALPAPLPSRDVALTAGDLGLALRALGLVGLAGVPALAATKRTGRIVVGVLLALAGAAVVVRSAGVLLDPDGAADPGRRSSRRPPGRPSPSPAVCCSWPPDCSSRSAGRQWAALGKRYEAPGAAAEQAPETSGPVAERELWEALDRGEDPTGRGGS